MIARHSTVFVSLRERRAARGSVPKKRTKAFCSWGIIIQLGVSAGQ